MNLAENLAEKIWIPVFVYPESLKNLDLTNIPLNVHIFFIGDSPSHFSIFPLFHFSTFHPWLSRDDLWDLIDLADISLLRGEISSLR
jgi:hypothetical protein